MDSFDENQRQLRVAVLSLTVILPLGIIGYRLIEQVSWLDALWITITTLTTIGYGDVVAQSDAGRVFTLVLIVFGLGSFALAAQAAVQIFVSPTIREMSRLKKEQHKIRKLSDHYIICGHGELVDKIIAHILHKEALTRGYRREQSAEAIEKRLSRLLRLPLLKRLKSPILRVLVMLRSWLRRGSFILDSVVVVTKDETYAAELREQGLLIIQGDPTDDPILHRAGITQAKSIVMMLDNDTETLLNVLTARSHSNQVYITAALYDDELALKTIRVGANNVLAPYDIAGQFLNNATLRPAVNDYFHSIIFDQKANSQIVQLTIVEGSAWINQSIEHLNLRERFETGVVGVRRSDGYYDYAPEDTYIVHEDDVLLVVTPGRFISPIIEDCRGQMETNNQIPNWQRLPQPRRNLTSDYQYTQEEAIEVAATMNNHYVIIGGGRIIQSALESLDPSRPFVVVSDDPQIIQESTERGFCVIQGNITKDETLRRAGIHRALATMISVEDDAKSVLTVLNSRTLNRSLLIIATAVTDDMILKLRRSGADRVVTPFRIAAQFVLLATTRPFINDFMHFVLFNYHDGIETTELYMQDDSPWIGKVLEDLYLRRIFDAGVIGIRKQDGNYIYAPPQSYRIEAYNVLIVVTPMDKSDDLRAVAHGGKNKRPSTLRTQEAMRTAITGERGKPNFVSQL